MSAVYLPFKGMMPYVSSLLLCQHETFFFLDANGRDAVGKYLYSLRGKPKLQNCLPGGNAGKKITAGHRPKTDQKAGMAVYVLNSPDIKPTRAREIELYLALFFFVCVKL